MTTITHKHEWDMGHRLPRHEGKCARLHGHRYVAEIDITGKVQTSGSGTGMVVDFYIVKDIVKATFGDWDHRTMLWREDPFAQEMLTDVQKTYGIFRVMFMPTAENIAAEIILRINVELRESHSLACCTRVRVYETPNGWAEVRG